MPQPACNVLIVHGHARGTRRDEAIDRCMTTIDLDQLVGVMGGAEATPADFGRCGPGSGMPWLGDVRTRECGAHDAAVRGAKAQGTPSWLAHVQALPLLPAAVGSYVRARITGR